MVINVETDADSLTWTLFQSSKKFLTFAGFFRVQERDSQGLSGREKGRGRVWRGTHWVTNTARAEEKCLQVGHDCVAVEVRTDSAVVKMLDHIDLDSFQASADVVTRVKVVDLDTDTRIEARNFCDLSDIDYCCPENKLIDKDRIRWTVKENIERISCDISQQEFEAHYVR